MHIIDKYCGSLTNLEVFKLVYDDCCFAYNKGVEDEEAHDGRETSEISGTAEKSAVNTSYVRPAAISLDPQYTIRHQSLNRSLLRYLTLTSPSVGAIGDCITSLTGQKSIEHVPREIVAHHHSTVMNFLSRKLHSLNTNFKLTESEVLQIINLGAYRPVELYITIDECSQRFGEDNIIAMSQMLSDTFTSLNSKLRVNALQSGNRRSILGESQKNSQHSNLSLGNQTEEMEDSSKIFAC